VPARPTPFERELKRRPLGAAKVPQELSRRREAVVSALGRVERAVASLGQDLDKKIAAVAS